MFRAGAAPIDPRFRRGAWLAAVLVYGITAWYSSGYHSADEHYQVIEFAEARLGHQPVGTLAWEYDARIRSAAQPTLCYAIFRAAHAAGLDDPFLLAFVLRALTALLALYATGSFVRAVVPRIASEWRKAFLLLSLFLWFLPFQYVRFAGETWSGLFGLLGFAVVLRNGPVRARWLRGGLLFGAAFLFRPPTLVMAISLVLWLALVKRERVRPVATVLIGVVAMMIAGIAIDSWYYGSFTVTTMNYLRLGLLGDGDHLFVAYPWWSYFAWVVKHGIAPIGALILVAFIVLCLKRPRSPFVWAIIPFLLLHVALPHKELRFLFPLVGLVPAVLALAWQEVIGARASRPVVRVAIALLIVLNMAGLLVIATTPAGSGRTTLARALWRLPPRPTTLRYVADDPMIWRIRIPRFYLPPNVTDDGTAPPCTGDAMIAQDTSACTADRAIAATTSTWCRPLEALYDRERDAPWTLYIHPNEQPPSRP